MNLPTGVTAAARSGNGALLGAGIGAAFMLAMAPASAASVTARAAPPTQAVRVVKNVIYERAGGVEIPLDVYVPGGSGPFPALVFIHGGGFYTGDKCQLRTAAQAHHFASVGFAVYNIDYRLAPKVGNFPTTLRCAGGTTTDVSHLQGHRFPAAADDAAAAVRWIRDNGAHYKTDTSRISCVGSSAGGTLCYGLGGRGLVDVQVGWSGPTKLDKPFALDIARNYVGCPLPTGSVDESSSVTLAIAAWIALDVLLVAAWLVNRRRRPSRS